MGAIEGPCKRGSATDCPAPYVDMVDPFYYYHHDGNGNAVTASVFVPDALWPDTYKYLYVDYISSEIYNLIEDNENGCRTCTPPRPGYRQEVFHTFARMVDMFFAPYKNTKALYYLSRGGGFNVRRIAYVRTANQPPNAVIFVAKTNYNVTDIVAFSASNSSDPEGDTIRYVWDFGDTRDLSAQSIQIDPKIQYTKEGAYTIQLTVTDQNGQSSQAVTTIYVGTPPTAIMESPAPGDQFMVGQSLQLSGIAKDSLDRPIPNYQISWEVQQHHGDHFHPFLDATVGNNFALQPAPPPEEYLAANSSYLKVLMSTVDSNGLVITISRDVYPKKVFLDIDSQPERGLTVLVDDFAVVTPATITSWENHEMTLFVEDQGNFVFESWNIGGGRETKYLVPAATATNPRIVASLKELVLRS